MERTSKASQLPATVKAAMLIAPVASMFAISPAHAGQVAPSVGATQSTPGAMVFSPGTDQPLERPNIPPIDQIPPEQMDDDMGFELDQEVGPGWGVFYNPATGEELEVFMDEQSFGQTSGFGGGYGGADGGFGIEKGADWQSMNSDMSLISNVGSHPWRMNVKVLIHRGTGWTVCSGTMRDAETVLTAGHCVYSQSSGWADEIYVMPGYDGDGWALPPDDSVGEYGWARGTYFGSWTGWTVDGDYNYDVGLIGVTRAVGVLTGWFGWAYGGDCSWHESQTYHSASYPAEGCGDPGLHNGLDMYYWYGNWDSCPSWNRLQIDTSGGCFNAVWGGMSGSGAYYIDNGNRYVHGICSTSDRSTYGRYARQWDDWVSWSNGTFIPNVRGATFDLQALDVNAEPATIEAGQSTTTLNHLAVNPTNGTASDTWAFDVYLSTNDNITEFDTFLGTQYYSWDFSAVSSVRVNMVQVTIPVDTPAGDYWIGVIYDDATDGNSDDNDSDGWDAAPITVSAAPCALESEITGAPATIDRGQTLSFTASAVNDCDGTRSFDEAVMNVTGPAALVKPLYDGADMAVDSGSSVSAPVNLGVPLTAPTGLYTVEVTLLLDGAELSSDSFVVDVQ